MSTSLRGEIIVNKYIIISMKKIMFQNGLLGQPHNKDTTRVGRSRAILLYSGAKKHRCTRETWCHIYVTIGIASSREITYHQITYFSNCKTKIMSVPAPNFDFVHIPLWAGIMQETDRNCAMVESLCIRV